MYRPSNTPRLLLPLLVVWVTAGAAACPRQSVPGALCLKLEDTQVTYVEGWDLSFAYTSQDAKPLLITTNYNPLLGTSEVFRVLESGEASLILTLDGAAGEEFRCLPPAGPFFAVGRGDPSLATDEHPCSPHYEATVYDLDGREQYTVHGDYYYLTVTEDGEHLVALDTCMEWEPSRIYLLDRTGAPLVTHETDLPIHSIYRMDLGGYLLTCKRPQDPRSTNWLFYAYDEALSPSWELAVGSCNGIYGYSSSGLAAVECEPTEPGVEQEVRLYDHGELFATVYDQRPWITRDGSSILTIANGKLSRRELPGLEVTWSRDLGDRLVSTVHSTVGPDPLTLACLRPPRNPVTGEDVDDDFRLVVYGPDGRTALEQRTSTLYDRCALSIDGRGLSYIQDDQVVYGRIETCSP